MTSIASAMSGALAAVSAARVAPSAPSPNLPALSVTEAQGILAKPPSAPLVAAISRATHLDKSTLAYVAINGETVTMQRDPLRVDRDTSAEAARRLAAINAVLDAKPSPQVLMIWLYKLGKLIERPPVGDELDDRVKALGSAIDLPAMCFTEETLAHAARTLVWWPGLAKLEAALGTVTAPMLAERTRLAAIVSSASQPALPAPDVARAAATSMRDRTPEEIAAVNAATQAFMAERNAAIAPAAVRGVRSAHLTGEALERFRDNPLVRAAKALQAQRARA